MIRPSKLFDSITILINNEDKKLGIPQHTILFIPLLLFLSHVTVLSEFCSQKLSVGLYVLPNR